MVIGGAGCIGSELTRALLQRGHRVRVVDNLSSGRVEHVSEFMSNPNFHFNKMDALNMVELDAELSGASMVWHLAAKTDIKFSDDYDFDADFTQNFCTTWTILKAMKAQHVGKLAFSSSAAVYGEASILDEDLIMPEPISMYGATKLACEAVIRAMALRVGIQSWCFRYCSIVSPKARKSGNMVIPDLLHKLQKDPTQLEIFGDGKQTKPSLLVTECVDAMLFIVSQVKDQFSIFNIGAPDAISVTRQAELIVEAMGLSGVKFNYTGGKGGWPGDVPSFKMHVDRLARIGWRAQHTSEEAVKIAIKGLIESGE